MKRRQIWILLLCALLVLCLTACREKPPEPQLNPDPPGGTTEDDADIPDGTLDYAAAYQTFAPDQVVMTVNGEDVTWQEYYRWLYYIVTHMEEQGEITDWDAPCAFDDTCTNAEYATRYAQSTAAQYHLIRQTAEARGLSLTAEEAQTVEQKWQDYVRLFGQEEDVLSHLASVYTTKEQYLFEREVAVLYEKLFHERYGENGGKCSDAQVADYASEHDYVHLEALFLSTVDEDKMLLEETEIQRKRELINDLYTQIALAADPTAEFETLYVKYNEDIVVEQYPDGYCSSLDLVPNVEMRDSINSLPVGGISKPMQGSYGFYIMHRLPLDYDGIVEYDKDSEQPYTLRYLTATSLFHEEAAELFAAADIVCSAELEALDLHTLFVRN